MKRVLVAVVLVSLVLGLWGPAARAAPPAGVGPFVPEELLVQYREEATPAQQRAAKGRVGATVKQQLRARADGGARLELVRLPGRADVHAAVATLRQDPAVAFAEPNWVYTKPVAVPAAYPQDRGFKDGGLWGMYGTDKVPAGSCDTGKVCTNQYGSQAADAWNRGHTGSRGVYVGVIDEGIWGDHPDLAANIWTNPHDPADGVDNDGNGYADDLHGWDFTNGDNTIFDRVPGDPARNEEDDHGTHVAGTIGAVGNNTGWDGGGLLGVNWQVSIIAAKFLGTGGGDTARAIAAIDYFVDLKARHGLNIVALNNSWVCYPGCYSQAFHDATIRAAKANILIVAAAGNNGSDNDAQPFFPAGYDTRQATATERVPATYDGVIAVAALTSKGALATVPISGWASNWGRTSVDLGAPGDAIWSTAGSVYYRQWSGTSMATPHVTGAAALYAAAYRAKLGRAPTGAEIRNALLGSAVATTSLRYKAATNGRLDVERAIATVGR